MTEYDPLLRDELVAAYLDGEATPAERAQVEADPDLLERAALLRQVSDMVAEPVMTPPPDVKRAHIAAALAASSTADNVTSLATRKRQMNWAKLGAVAAVVIAVLAVPIVLLSGDDDDTVATGVSSDFDDTAATDDGGDGTATELEAAGRDLDDDAEESAGAAEFDDGAAGDDGGSFEAEEDAMVEAEEESEPLEAAPQPTPPADSGADAEEGAVAEEGDGGESDVPSFDIGARRVDLPPVADAAGIGAVLGDAIGDATASGDSRNTADLACTDAFLTFIEQDPTFETVAGTVTVGGDPSEYIARLADPTVIVVYDDVCNVVEEVFAAPVLTGN